MKRRKWLCAAAAVLIVAADYLWSLWYYGGLYRAGALLSTARVTAGNVGALLAQNLLVNLPALLLALGALAMLRGRFLRSMGLRMESGRGRATVGIAAIAYAALLAAALLFGRRGALTAAYQWVYDLLFVALEEEFVFRAVLPGLLAGGGLPARCVWILPGALFGCVHTLMPLIVDGGAAAAWQLSSVAGYALMACALYALRLWSGTLWLPVLVHAALDFLGAAF